jgi:hypothetical protein
MVVVVVGVVVVHELVVDVLYHVALLQTPLQFMKLTVIGRVTAVV